MRRRRVAAGWRDGLLPLGVWTDGDGLVRRLELRIEDLTRVESRVVRQAIG